MVVQFFASSIQAYPTLRHPWMMRSEAAVCTLSLAADSVVLILNALFVSCTHMCVLTLFIRPLVVTIIVVVADVL